MCTGDAAFQHRSMTNGKMEIHHLASERFGAVRKTGTGGSMSSSGHLMIRSGVQIFKCATGHLSGSVAI